MQPVPGPCAAIAALSASGLATDRFLFEGFLPARTGARRNRLLDLAGETATLVFYEAPHRVSDTLADMADVLGAGREAVLAMALEWKFSKEEILELYLNKVYFGGGAYGVDSASRRFFSHPATDLSVGEAAIIAGLVKAPSYYDPFLGDDARKERSLERARELGFNRLWLHAKHAAESGDGLDLELLARAGHRRAPGQTLAEVIGELTSHLPRAAGEVGRGSGREGARGGSAH